MSEDRGYRVEGLVVGTRRDGKRRYDESAKARLIGLCMQPGASVAAIAVSNGLNQRCAALGRAGEKRMAAAADADIDVVAGDRE